MPTYITGEAVEYQDTWTDAYPDTPYSMLLSKVGPVGSVAGYLTGKAAVAEEIVPLIALPPSWVDNPSGGSAVFRDTRGSGRGALLGWVVVDPGDDLLWLIVAPAVTITTTDIIGINHVWITRP